MIFLMFVFGFLCGIVMATAFYAFLIDPMPRSYLHTTWKPMPPETEALKLPTGELLRSWHNSHAKEDSWLL